MKYRILVAIMAVSLVVACGDGGGEANNGGDNNGSTADAGADTSSDTDEEEDVPTVGDVSSEEFDHRCGDAPIGDWPLNDAVSQGDVSASTADGVTTLEIDASAGGSMASADNPFTYVDLSSGEKVEVTDLEAYSNTDWDLAFKRVVIRTNSEDSGPGDVTVAQLTQTSFEEVTEVPSDPGTWETDQSYDDNCEPITDPIGSLTTAFHHLNAGGTSGSWYAYDQHQVAPHEGDVYLIEVPSEGATYKMSIDAWNDGVYTIRVAEL